MVLTLRRTIKREDREIPDHFEGIGLLLVVRLPALIGGGGGVAAGIAMMVMGAGTRFEGLGAFVAAIAGIVLFAAIRCRRFEIEIGGQWLRTGAGPLRRRVPREMIVGFSIAPATGWRRLYAHREVRLELSAGDLSRAFPSRDPEEVLRFLS